MTTLEDLKKYLNDNQIPFSELTLDGKPFKFLKNKYLMINVGDLEEDALNFVTICISNLEKVKKSIKFEKVVIW